MGLKVKIFPRAQADLRRQYTWYLKNAEEEVADRYIAAFWETVETLNLHEALGPLGNFPQSRLASIRYYPFVRPYEKHLIFHRTDKTTLSIVRVMHGARDLPRRLRE